MQSESGLRNLGGRQNLRIQVQITLNVINFHNIIVSFRCLPFSIHETRNAIESTKAVDKTEPGEMDKLTPKPSALTYK